MNRGDIAVETLLKVVLVLVVVWLGLEVLGELLNLLLGPLPQLLGLLIAILIVLWLLDRI